MEKIPMTIEGFNKIQEDLHRLKTQDLKECLENISDARDKGDISENAEYDIAKQNLEELNKKMSRLGELINNAHIITGAVDDGTVGLLTYVKVKNLKTNETFTYKIVPEYEISLKDFKISQKSPIGKSLYGKRKGEKVSVDIPIGKIELEILDVSVKC